MRALLVIDMIKDFVDPEGALYIGEEGEELVPRIKKRLQEYRGKGEPVIYICDRHIHQDGEFAMFPPHALPGTEGEEIVPELLPGENEPVIYKRRFSGFFGTDLDLTLREKGIDSLELVGVVTNICILYTAAEARMLNYGVEVEKSLVASFDEEAHEFALKEMDKTLGVEVR